jgi:hypothetical protein
VNTARIKAVKIDEGVLKVCDTPHVNLSWPPSLKYLVRVSEWPLPSVNAYNSRHLQWFNYSDDESTWEVKENLTSVRKHIKEFWNDLGINKREFDGHEVHASEENIGELFSVLKFHGTK